MSTETATATNSSNAFTSNLHKLKERKNRCLIYAYLITCASFVISIKLVYFSFDHYLLKRDEQNQQNAHESSANKNNENGPYVITKIIYEDPLLMTLLFQISFIILFPLLQVYYFIKYHITPKQQLLNILKLHRDHDDNVFVDTEKNLALSSTKSRPSLDTKRVYRPSTDLHFDGLSHNNISETHPIDNIVEENENEENDNEFDINDLQPFPQSNQNSFANIQKISKIPDYKNKNKDEVESNVNTQSPVSITKSLIKVLYSLKPLESCFFAIGTSLIIYSMFKGINLIPFLDAMIVFNLSAFEILSLLLSCVNITFLNFENIYKIKALHKPNNKNFSQLLKTFSAMCICVCGCFLATSERKGTVLASTATSNFDPFIFNRLGGCLILGLITLLIGPLVILWSTVVMQYLYVLIYNNNYKSMKTGSRGLYRVFSNSALYTAFRSRQNTLSLEMDIMNNGSSNSIADNHSDEVDHEQDYTKNELDIQFQSLLTFQISFISTIAFIILLTIKLLIPSNNTNLSGMDDESATDMTNVLIETSGIDSKFLSNLLFTFPSFLIGLLYLSKRVKVGVLVSLPMFTVFLSFLIELIWPSGSNGTTLAPGDFFEKGEAMGYVVTGVGAVWSILAHQ